MDKKDRNAKIEAYGNGFNLLTQALAEVPTEAREFKPTPADWSVHKIVVHMADSESMAALRVRKLIVEPGSQLMGYDEARWADALHYKDQNMGDALEIIKFARQSTYRLLKTLPENVFEHEVHHPEYDRPYSFDRWLEIYSRHIPDHIDQLQRSVQAWRESKH